MDTLFCATCGLLGGAVPVPADEGTKPYDVVDLRRPPKRTLAETEAFDTQQQDVVVVSLADPSSSRRESTGEK